MWHALHEHVIQHGGLTEGSLRGMQALKFIIATIITAALREVFGWIVGVKSIRTQSYTKAAAADL